MHRKRPSDKQVKRKLLVPLGDSLKQLRELPTTVRRAMGQDLQDVQCGRTPRDSKWLTGIHPAVQEIRKRHDKESYRAVYTVALGDVVYLLHVFHKKSNDGISTPRKHLDIVKQRLAEALKLEQKR